MEQQKKPNVREMTPDEEMELVNRFSRRALKREEVFLFSVILCDNEVDRDGERFTCDALESLSRLFIGKTGIFDHNPQGQNQTARIYEAHVEEDSGRITKTGEPYRCVKARAYMVKTQANRDLILEIDGGIKKEVSVGCSVARAVCSVCGADTRKEDCGHRQGQTYGGVYCCVELDQPTDAYEWSFVAVPAQVGAGVTKAHGHGPFQVTRQLCEIRKALEQGDGRLNSQEARQLGRELSRLEQEAQAGRGYLTQLRKDAVRLSFLSGSGIPGVLMEEAIKGMSYTQLEELCRGLRDKLESPQDFQLKAGKEPACSHEEFKI